MDPTVVSLAERWDLFEIQDRICSEAWPEFMLHDPVAGECWMRFIEGRKDCQRLLMQGDEILGIVNSMPIRLDGLDSLSEEGWDWALRKSVEDHEAGRTPNALFGVQVVINPKHQGKGLSAVAVGVMRTIAADLGLPQIVIPVRPDGKARFPLVPMDTYVAWKGAGGLPADNWLRVHVRAGGQILRTCPRAMEIRGTVNEWERWTGLPFPLSGDHLVPGALAPVRFDLAADQGVYIEPNVWVVHSVG